MLLPLGLIGLITMIVGYFLSVRLADYIYDHNLLNSADSVAARVKSDGSKVWVDLPFAAQSILRHGKKHFYYQVLKEDGSTVAGEKILTGPFFHLKSPHPIFKKAFVHGQEVRIARIRAEISNLPSQTILVQVAETLESRQRLIKHILLSMMVPQLILMLLGICLVSIGINKGLEPLKKLAQAIAQRSKDNLEPVPDVNVPHEVGLLISAINELLKRIKIDVDLKQRFIANAAHQLRTPIAGFKTYIGYGQRIAEKSATKMVLNRLDKASDRLAGMVNKLLALTKAESLKKTKNFSRLDLNSIASTVASHFLSLASNKNISLDLELCSSPAIISGNQNELEELISNLIENAILYTPSDGKVWISIQKTNTITTLSVEDNGPGIPEEDQERVFDRFYRALGTEVSGSGLGLAIAKEVADAHDAEIVLENGREGNGTKFTVHFPNNIEELSSNSTVDYVEQRHSQSEIV